MYDQFSYRQFKETYSWLEIKKNYFTLKDIVQCHGLWLTNWDFRVIFDHFEVIFCAPGAVLKIGANL